MILIGYWTGLRLSDVAELERGEIQLSRRALRIVPNKVRNRKPCPLAIPLVGDAETIVRERHHGVPEGWRDDLPEPPQEGVQEVSCAYRKVEQKEEVRFGGPLFFLVLYPFFMVENSSPPANAFRTREKLKTSLSVAIDPTLGRSRQTLDFIDFYGVCPHIFEARPVRDNSPLSQRQNPRLWLIRGTVISPAEGRNVDRSTPASR